MSRSASGLLLILLLPTCCAEEDPVSRAAALRAKGAASEARRILQPLPQTKPVLSELSLTELDLGDYRNAIGHADMLEDLCRSKDDLACAARANNFAGLGHLYLSEYSDARKRFEKSLELHERLGDRESVIVRRNNLANVSYFQGRYQEAYDLYRQAMDQVLATRAEPWNNRVRQITLTNLAVLFQKVGREDRALMLYNDLRGDGTGLRPSEEARQLVNRGALFRRLGDPYKALDTYRAAGQLFRNAKHPDGELGALKNSGIALALDLAQPDKALPLFDQALALARQSANRRETAQILLYRAETLRRLGRRDAAREQFVAARNLATELNATEEHWKALYGLGRVDEDEGRAEDALTLYRQAVARIESVRAGMNRAELKSEFLADKRDVYDAVIRLLLPNPASAPEIFTVLEREHARSQRDLLNPGSAAATIESTAARLDPDTILLSFWFSARRAAVFTVFQGQGTVARIQNPDRAAALLANLAGGPNPNWRQDSAEAGRLLLAAVPQLNHPAIRHAIVINDGPLHLTPFELLTLPTSNQLAIERFDVSYFPSATQYVLHKDPERPPVRWPWQSSLLAIGAPAVSADANPLSPGETAPLPFAQHEIDSIARQLPGRTAAHTGPDARRSWLTQTTGQPVIHLATHASANTESADRSRILFAPESPGRPPEYLYLPEVAALSLPDLRLLTLSACETERGRIVQGEGVQSFGRAFLSAGAAAVVSTLWRVSDRSAAAFMDHFYYHLGQGASPASALRATKLTFLKNNEAAHPRVWAAFVLVGDGVHPIYQPFPILPVAAAVAVLATLVLLLHKYRNH